MLHFERWLEALSKGSPAFLGSLTSTRVLLVKVTTEITPQVFPNSIAEVILPW